ncbi:MAG TPA: ABC transporter permease subunit [Bacteroidota bacterium]
MAGNIRTIFLKELRSFFSSAVAYIVIVVFLVLLGWFFWNDVFVVNLATLRPLFETTPFLLLFFAPAVTMRLISEEKKMGTFELLVTKPVTEFEIIAGKFLAAWVLVLVALVPTVSYFISISAIGSLDVGPVIGGYFGLALVGAVYVSIGLFGSSLTENQVVAFIVSFLIVFMFFMFDKILIYLPAGIASVVEYLGIDYHFGNVARGVIDSRDMTYYLSLIGAFLFLSTVSLQRRKW